MATPRKIRGARVLVTGAASGLGAGLALELARRGAASVSCWDRDATALADTVERIEALGIAAHAITVDLSDLDQVKAAGERTLAATGGIDICINSAGVVSGKLFTDLTEQDVTRTFQVNTLALYRTTRVVLPGMLDRDRGLIVTIASAGGLTGVAKQTDYSASKFAAVGFMESLRAELRKMHSAVRTLVVCPYYTDTGMFAGVRTKVPALLPTLEPEQVVDQIADAIESGRQRLILPAFAGTVLWVKALPPAIADRIIDLFGINSTMDSFVGRRTHPESD